MARLKPLAKSLGRITTALLVILVPAFYIQPYDMDLKQRQPNTPLAPEDPNSALLFSSKARVLVVTAHPDDEAYYIGGTLSRLGVSGATIYEVVATYGDKGYYGPFTNVDENRRVRKAEALASAKKSHVSEVIFLGLPDGRVRNSEAVRQKLDKVIREVRPTHILTFEDLYPIRISHRDHRRIGEATVQAAKEVGYHGWLMLFMTGAPNYKSDISKFWEDKTSLLTIHQSQFHGDRLETVKLSLMSDAIEAAEGTEFEYVEPFRVERF